MNGDIQTLELSRETVLIIQKIIFLKTNFLASFEFPCNSIIRKRVMNDPSKKKKVRRKLLSQ